MDVRKTDEGKGGGGSERGRRKANIPEKRSKTTPSWVVQPR